VKSLLNENLHIKNLRIYKLELLKWRCVLEWEFRTWSTSCTFYHTNQGISAVGELALGAFETWNVKCFKGILSG